MDRRAQGRRSGRGSAALGALLRAAGPAGPARLAPCAGADEDEEDAALSAFDSFCAGLARGRFPKLADREDLWRLLVVITSRKASAQADRRRALKRNGMRLRVDPGGPAQTGTTRMTTASAELVGREPTPEFAAMMAEEFRRLLDRLGDEQLRQIALQRMEGYTGDEIAERLGWPAHGCPRLELIRQLWTEESEASVSRPGSSRHPRGYAAGRPATPASIDAACCRLSGMASRGSPIETYLAGSNLRIQAELLKELLALELELRSGSGERPTSRTTTIASPTFTSSWKTCWR